MYLMYCHKRYYLQMKTDNYLLHLRLQQQLPNHFLQEKYRYSHQMRVESFEHDKTTNKKRAVNKGYEFLIIETFIKTIPPIGGIELV